MRHACYEGIEDRSWIVDQDREERSRGIWPGSIKYSPQLSSTARVAALQGKDFGLQDRETAQVVRRSGQEVQDKTEQDRSDLPDRSTRFILVKQDIYLDHIAHFQQDRPISRPDRTDSKARSTQDYYLLSEDFRTAKTPIPKTDRDQCDSRSRPRHHPIVTATTQDQDRRTPVRGVKIPAPEANSQSNLSARSTSPKVITKSSSQPNRRIHKVSTRLYYKARIGVPPP